MLERIVESNLSKIEIKISGEKYENNDLQTTWWRM